MIKTPDQDLYDEIYRQAKGLGYEVYLFNPTGDAAYPYVKLGMVQVVPISSKSYLLGTAFVTFDVWGNESSRRLVAAMAHNLINAISKIKETKNGLQWSMDRSTVSTEVLPDDSTNDNLWRASVSLQMNFR